MKKLLLCGSALFLMLGSANAQGWNTKGASDDFKTTDNYVNGPNNEGVYWWVTDTNAMKISRPGTGTMTLTATNLGACSSCFPQLGVDFGTVNGNPVTLDLTTGADIYLEVENTVNSRIFATVLLTDINDKVSKIEPNVSDVTSNVTWGTAGNPRKSQNGFSFGDYVDSIPTETAKGKKKIFIDLSSVPSAMGGLTDDAWTCSTPYNCPTTSYAIDVTKIKAVAFMINFGVNNVFVSEGNGTDAHKEDTYIQGKFLKPYTGALKFTTFVIGESTNGVGINENLVTKSLNVYPNPASDAVNVTFESNSIATVSITDLFGRTVYTNSANAGKNNISINTSNLSTGMYLVNVTSSNGSVSSKITIK